jgi:DNA-binding NtrC family response regulator
MANEARLKLLVIDDDAQNLELISDALRQEGVEITQALGPYAGLEKFASLHPRIVLLDLVMPEMDGMEVLERIIAADPGVDVILMTAHYSAESAVEAIQKGAADYLTKPLDLEKLRNRLKGLLADAQTRHNTLKLDNQLVGAYQFEGIVGRSPLMLEVFAKIRRVSPHFRTVLVTGATGTGKELVARSLHRLSPVANGPFVVCNCAALVETLAESELFGYVKGAFTGANQDKKGLFELANGGSVFLDEIGELPLAGQAKLLRVLQNRQIQRVGSPLAHDIDVRVVAATNRDLKGMVREGRFREDLYYRLAMMEISLPRLVDRREDLPLLQRFFVEQYAATYGKQITGFTRRAQMRMSVYAWPGNVRQLENVIGSACMLADSSVLDVHDLPIDLQEAQLQPFEQTDLISLEEVQRRHVLKVLEHVAGNKARAAEILGIGRGTIYHFLSKIKSDDAPKKQLEEKEVTNADLRKSMRHGSI